MRYVFHKFHFDCDLSARNDVYSPIIAVSQFRCVVFLAAQNAACLLAYFANLGHLNKYSKKYQMRIKSTELKSVKRSLPLAGRIKIGEKRQTESGKEYPTSTDYFVIDADEIKAMRVKELYGEKPTSIPIQFYSDDEDQSLSHYYELRDNSGKLISVGDGEAYRVVQDDGTWLEVSTVETINIHVRPLIKKYATDKFTPKWKEVCRIRFLIPDTQIIGYWEFVSSGKETTIPKLLGTYDLILRLRGSVVGVTFTLDVEKHKSNTSGQSKSYPIVTLNCDMANQREGSLLSSPDIKMLE